MRLLIHMRSGGETINSHAPREKLLDLYETQGCLGLAEDREVSQTNVPGCQDEQCNANHS